MFFPSRVSPPGLQISASSLPFLEVIKAGLSMHRSFDFLVVFVGFLLFSIVNVLASLANEIKTILADPFINVLDGELNNLKDNHVRDILIEVLGD